MRYDCRIHAQCPLPHHGLVSTRKVTVVSAQKEAEQSMPRLLRRGRKAGGAVHPLPCIFPFLLK